MNAPAGGTRPVSPDVPREWNADVYHRVSDPQRAWGTEVLSRLPLAGTELVLDVGCGTGRLTFALLQRLPRGRAIGVDLSANMIATAGPPGSRLGLAHRLRACRRGGAAVRWMR